MTTRLAVDGFDYSAARGAGLALLTATLHEDTSAREELARDLGETTEHLAVLDFALQSACGLLRKVRSVDGFADIDAALQDLAAFMASRDGDAS